MQNINIYKRKNHHKQIKLKKLHTYTIKKIIHSSSTRYNSDQIKNL